MGRESLRRYVFGDGDVRDRLRVSEILRDETVGGGLMLGATVVALLWANLAPDSYLHLTHLRVGDLTVHEWAADGLLTLFFLVAGLELKRELTEGSLRRPADALVPILAAVGGMAAPALVYLLVTGIADADRAGWAVPMATDIAFALAVLAIAGSRLPASLRAFLLTLAIVDDLGAIIVIAVAFTATIAWGWLAASVGCVVVLFLLQRRRIDHPILLALLALGAWWFMLRSGVHATIAGVLVGLTLRNDVGHAHDPLGRWQHRLEPWSAAVAVPLFALVSAGVPVDAGALRRVVTTAVPLAIVVALVLGKLVGISLTALATTRFTHAEFAPGIRWPDVLAVAQLSGIGFTVALLISDLAFGADQGTADAAKAAVLLASLASALLGGLAAALRGRRHPRPGPTPAAPDDGRDRLV